MTLFPRQAPFDLRFEPGYQIALREKLAAEERDRGRILAHFHLRLFELKAEYEALRRKYSPSQPRVPAGNSDGGQWTSGGGGGHQFADRVQFSGVLSGWNYLSESNQSICTFYDKTFDYHFSVIYQGNNCPDGYINY